MLCLVANAQKTKSFVFYRNGQVVLTIPVAQVDSIVFASNTTIIIDDTTNNDSINNDTIPNINPPIVTIEPVDLGLSVKWAPFNLDATVPEEYGGYYTFGGVATQEIYDDVALIYARRELTYEQQTDLNTLDDISGSTVDAATLKWGGQWRIPTWKEWCELREECTWEWIVLNDTCGMKVTGPNGNSIFLPASGYMRSKNTSKHDADPAAEYGFDGLVRAGKFASYTTSGTLSSGTGSTGGVIYFNFKDNYMELSATEYMGNYITSTYFGRCIRPVYGEHTEPGKFIDQRQGLLAIGYEGWNGMGPSANWNHYDNWDTETMLGEWYGVTTDEKGRVVGINWEDNNLWGFHVNTPTVNGDFGVNLPYLRDVNINNNPNIGYHGIGIKGTQIKDLMLDNVGFNAYSHGPSLLEGITNVTIQNCHSQYYGIKGDFENLTIRNINTEPWDWRWDDDSDMPFVLQEGTAKNILVENCEIETDIIAICDEFTIRNTRVEHYHYSSQQIDEGTTKPSKWKTQIAKRFECDNSTLIVKDLNYDDFADGCEMIFNNATITLEDGTILTGFSATFTNSEENWKQYMK